MTNHVIDIRGQELLSSKRAAQKRGLTIAEHAAELGLSYTTYKSRVASAIANEIKSPLSESRYPRWDNAPQISGNVIILGDLHIPYHHAEFTNRCILLAKQWGITQAVLGGDALDAAAFSAWPDDVAAPHTTLSGDAEKILLTLAETMPDKYRSKLNAAIAEMSLAPDNLADELKESRKVLRQLAGAFENILWFTGNHESRIVRRIEKALPLSEIASLYGADDPKWTFSGYYFAEVESGGVKYRITHPKNSAKGSSKRLAPKYQENIVMLHGHHFSVQSDPSGRFVAIEPGACCDFSRLDYDAQRDTTGDAHVLGAVIIRDGRPWLLNQWTDFERLMLL